MVDWSKAPRDYPVTAIQFTKNTHMDTYPAVDPSAPEINLRSKVVIITGASRGIGAQGMVPAFVKAGVRGIALLATNAEKLKNIERTIKKTNADIATLVCPLDVSDDKGIEGAFSAIKSKFGHADILIHAAGLVSDDNRMLHETDQDKWWRNFEINGKGTYLLMHAFLRQLPSPDAPAAIVNLTSWQPFFEVPEMGGYFMSKFVMDNLTSYVANTYPSVTVVALYPGLVLTDALREPFRTLFDLNSAELVGATAVWVCQEKAKFLSGRWISTNWDVEDLVARKEEIVRDDLLKLTLKGKFGADVAMS